MATYPGAVYEPRTKENKDGVVYEAAEKTTLFAEDVVKDDDEIVAIETELGTNPKGAKADVKTRLDDVDTAIATKISKTIAGELDAMAAKESLADNDNFLIEESAASDAKKKTVWSTIKSVLKTYFDTLYLALAGGTMTGDIQLGETDIKLDAVLSGDEKWSGIVISGTAGATIAVGDLCYLDVTAGKWKLVDGILDGTDIGFKAQLGICVLAGNDTDPTEMLIYGKIRSVAFPNLTIGAPVYIDDTAGNVVVVQPTTTNFVIRIVGYAITAEDLLFNPSNDYIVHV